jgi:deoxycytidine triphosphate deaminase
MILSGASIERAVADGELGIDPFVKDHIKDASYTFTLGPRLTVNGSEQMIGPEGYLLEPNGFVLGYTEEKLSLRGKYGCFLSTRGSIAQMGLSVLLGSTFAEPDTDQTITLEIHNVSRAPIRLEAGMKLVKGIFIPVG